MPRGRGARRNQYSGSRRSPPEAANDEGEDNSSGDDSNSVGAARNQRHKKAKVGSKPASEKTTRAGNGATAQRRRNQRGREKTTKSVRNSTARRGNSSGDRGGSPQPSLRGRGSSQAYSDHFFGRSDIEIRGRDMRGPCGTCTSVRESNQKLHGLLLRSLAKQRQAIDYWADSVGVGDGNSFEEMDWQYEPTTLVAFRFQDRRYSSVRQILAQAEQRVSEHTALHAPSSQQVPDIMDLDASARPRAHLTSLPYHSRDAENPTQPQNGGYPLTETSIHANTVAHPWRIPIPSRIRPLSSYFENLRPSTLDPSLQFRRRSSYESSEGPLEMTRAAAFGALRSNGVDAGNAQAAASEALLTLNSMSLRPSGS